MIKLEFTPLSFMSSVLFITALLFGMFFLGFHYGTKINENCQIIDTVTVVEDNDYKWYDVTATGYNPTSNQTDFTPSITASGAIINLRNPLSSRIVGLPQNMIKRYNRDAPFSYGDTIFVYSPDLKFPYWGLWKVADCCSKKNRNNIDFCIGKKDSNNLFKNIKIRKF